MGLNCYRSRERFSELLDGALSESERARVQAHMAGCERCAGDYELFRCSTRLVQGLNPIPVAPDFTARVMSRLRAGARSAQPGAARMFPGRPLVSAWYPYAVAAAAAAALTIGLWHWTALPRANSGAIPFANQAAPAPATPVAGSATPVPGQLAVTPAGLRAGSGAPRSGTRASGAPALARGAGVDTLYDQPFENGLPPVPGYDRGVPVNAPAESVRILR